MKRRDVLKAGLGAAVGLPLLGRETAQAMQNDFKGEVAAPTSSLALWYRRPAQQWLEALPIGNGRLGAMVFGGVDVERLQLNEDTVWAGGPHNYNNPEALAALPEIRRLVFEGRWHEAQSLADAKFMGRPVGQMPYQPVGNLTLDLAAPQTVSDYRRELDLDTAVTRVSYAVDGVRYSREAFASAPDQVLVLRLTADKPGSISFFAAFDSPQKSTSAAFDRNTLALDGISGDAAGIEGRVKFRAMARALAEGGTVRTGNGRVIVETADAVTLLLSIATSYRNFHDVGGDAVAKARGYLEAASRRKYPQLRQAHVADYRRLFGRVQFALGTSEAAKLPTDERVATFKNGHDPQLAALHFQFGRYLLISCSRPGGQPANLQGLWNEHMAPPWGSKYTVNINTEMNYWPTAPANLLECYEPLFSLLDDVAQTGARTAKTQYGAGGWVLHHNTDGWRGTAPVDGAAWGMTPTCGAWLAKSLWDHFEFSGDTAALHRHYPILKGAAQFFLDTLQTEPRHGWLVTNPSASPENSHHGGSIMCAGPTMDMQILRDLFEACAQASEVLNTDADFRRQVLLARARLAPMQVGKAGQLQEWLEDWDMSAPEIHHRHVSHLYGLYPSAQITRRGTPELFDAARKSLEIRGDEATGWSMGWKINLWARLEDGDHAYKLVSDLLTPERTAPNLLDLHPPFQIDGNFGYTSGVCEMLLQSHSGEIHLLPALPAAWPDGHVRGLRARGNVEVEINWRRGQLHMATLRPHLAAPLRLRTAIPVGVSRAGKPVKVQRPKDNVITFNAAPGSVYEISLMQAAPKGRRQ